MSRTGKKRMIFPEKIIQYTRPEDIFIVASECVVSDMEIHANINYTLH